MAKTADRKVEVAKRIGDMAVRRARPRPRVADLRRAHLHAHHRRRGVAAVGGRDDRGHPQHQGGAAQGQDVARRLERLLRRLARRARGAQLASSSTTASRPGSTWRWSSRTDITPYAEIPDDERELTDDLVFNKSRGRARALHRALRVRRARRPTRRRRPTPPPAWSPRRRCTGTSCAARRTAWRTGSTARSRRSAPCPTLNDVLLPAMKEVGDKFGAGELILPFVLQSAEVMKRAVAQLENYLERMEGHTKGKVVIATVFGDVHDIGKSLVNTILTNNGYTVIDLGKQVPSTRSSTPRSSTRPTRSACPPCSCRPPSRCRSACRSCTSAGSSSRC